jgi:hypothetical protein
MAYFDYVSKKSKTPDIDPESLKSMHYTEVRICSPSRAWRIFFNAIVQIF